MTSKSKPARLLQRGTMKDEEGQLAGKTPTTLSVSVTYKTTSTSATTKTMEDVKCDISSLNLGSHRTSVLRPLSSSHCCDLLDGIPNLNIASDTTTHAGSLRKLACEHSMRLKTPNHQQHQNTSHSELGANLPRRPATTGRMLLPHIGKRSGGGSNISSRTSAQHHHHLRPAQNVQRNSKFGTTFSSVGDELAARGPKDGQTPPPAFHLKARADAANKLSKYTLGATCQPVVSGSSPAAGKKVASACKPLQIRPPNRVTATRPLGSTMSSLPDQQHPIPPPPSSNVRKNSQPSTAVTTSSLTSSTAPAVSDVNPNYLKTVLNIRNLSPPTPGKRGVAGAVGSTARATNLRPEASEEAAAATSKSLPLQSRFQRRHASPARSTFPSPNAERKHVA